MSSNLRQLFFTICFLAVIEAQSQPVEINLKQGNLTRLLDIFIGEVTSKYDSLFLNRDKRLGIISVEILDFDKRVLPFESLKD